MAQSEYKKRHDIFAKIIHMNLSVKFNLLKDTQPHYIYKPESCLEIDNYKLYRASHIRLISEFILYATKSTNDADYLIPFIM
jgi:hypothetical protein